MIDHMVMNTSDTIAGLALGVSILSLYVSWCVAKRKTAIAEFQLEQNERLFLAQNIPFPDVMIEKPEQGRFPDVPLVVKIRNTHPSREMRSICLSASVSGAYGERAKKEAEQRCERIPVGATETFSFSGFFHFISAPSTSPIIDRPLGLSNPMEHAFVYLEYTADMHGEHVRQIRKLIEFKLWQLGAERHLEWTVKDH